MTLDNKVWFLSKDGIKELKPQAESQPRELHNDKQAIHESLQRQREKRTKRVKSILP